MLSVTPTSRSSGPWWGPHCYPVCIQAIKRQVLLATGPRCWPWSNLTETHRFFLLPLLPVDNTKSWELKVRSCSHFYWENSARQHIDIEDKENRKKTTMSFQLMKCKRILSISTSTRMMLNTSSRQVMWPGGSVHDWLCTALAQLYQTQWHEHPSREVPTYMLHLKLFLSNIIKQDTEKAFWCDWKADVGRAKPQRMTKPHAIYSALLLLEIAWTCCQSWSRKNCLKHSWNRLSGKINCHQGKCFQTMGSI